MNFPLRFFSEWKGLKFVGSIYCRSSSEQDTQKQEIIDL